MVNVIKKIIKADDKAKKIYRRLFRPINEFVFYDLISKYKPLKKVVILQTPEHNNMGDHAIALATKMWIQDHFPKDTILEFSYEDIKFRFNAIKKIINNDDIIILQGGGNFGDLYLYEEIERRKVIKFLNNNKIIIMPQSINYSNTKEGQHQLNKTKEIFRLHRNLTICCRDEISYLFAKQHFFKNKIQLAPDIVHYLQGFVSDERKNTVLLSFRNDKECAMDSTSREKIESIFKKNNINYVYKDTVIDTSVYGVNRSQKVKEILTSFAKSKLVITDRFHGMVFSVITGTPCIVFKSLDHKITAGVKWYGGCRKVRYIDADIDSFIEAFNELIKMEDEKLYIDVKSELLRSLENVISTI